MTNQTSIEQLDLAKLTDAYERNGLMGVQELAISALSQARQEALEQYTDFLVKHNYCDSDVYAEEPKAIDRFLALTTEGKHD